jgi:hypothetical protein
MRNDIKALLKPLNLTRHNCKEMSDFSAIYGLVASVSEGLRPAIIDELMVYAITGKNIDFVYAVQSLERVTDRERIASILMKSIVARRAFKSETPIAEYLKKQWDYIGIEAQHEIVATVFSTIGTATNDKESDLQFNEQALKTFSMINDGNVDIFVNTIIAANEATPLCLSRMYKMKLIALLANHTEAPRYRQDVINHLGDDKFALKGYANSLKNDLFHCLLRNEKLQLNCLLREHLYQFHDEVFSFMLKHDNINWLGGHFTSLINSIFHGSWLDSVKNDKGLQLIDKLIESPDFYTHFNINHKIKYFTGTESSCYFAQKMHQKGMSLEVTHSEFSEDENIFYGVVAKYENASAEFKKTITEIAFKMSSIKKFIYAYDAVRIEGSYTLPDHDSISKIRVIAALAYYEANSEKPIPRDNRPVEKALKNLTNKSADPFFMLSGISRWIAEDVDQKTLYDARPKDSQYLKEMIGLGILDKDYIEKLNSKHKREILDKDMGL